MKALLHFLKSEDGPTAVEYAVMLALILGVCFASISMLVDATAESYENSGDQINTALSAGSGS